MTAMKPVRPQLNVSSGPLPEKRRRVDGGEGEQDEQMEENEQMYEPTEAAEPVRMNDVENDELFASSDEAKDSNVARVPGTSEPIICKTRTDERIPNKLTSPIKPLAEDVDEHNISHLPDRSWCDICNQACGKEDAHPRGAQTEEDKSGLPIVSLDYPSINEGTDKELKMIVGTDETTGNKLAHFVTCKGLADEWVIRKMIKDFEEMDRAHMILKTDGEPAIVAVQNRLQALRPGRTVPRNPPAYNPQSNGPCEKAVQDVTGQLRKVKLALEARLKIAIDDDLPIIQWALEHAVFLLNKLSVGHDGMTACERLTGRKWRRPLVEFGEIVLAKLALRRTGRGKVKQQKKKLAARTIEGVWVGQIARTGEHLIIKPNGDAVRCRTIRRVPIEHRWNPERVLLIRATPRLPAPSSKRPEEIEPKIVDEEEHLKVGESSHVYKPAESQDPNSGASLELPQGRHRGSEIREFRINDRLLEKYGFSSNCPGCEHKASGLPGHALHTNPCRSRFRNLMEADEDDNEVVARAKRRREAATSRASDQKVETDEPAPAPGTPRFGNDGDAEKSAENEPMEHSANIADPEDNDKDLPPQLQEESDDEMDIDEEGRDTQKPDPLADLKRSFEEEDDEEKDQRDEKRQRLKLFTPNLQAETCVGRSMCAAKPSHRSETMQLLAAELAKAKSHIDVKEIIRKLEKDPKLQAPTNHRQRRTAQQGKGKYDIAEMYSPPRITKTAKAMGLKDGWALDLTESDPEDNEPWDFSRKEKRDKAKRRVDEDKPMMVIVSPMCGPFSQLQEVFNYPKMEKSKVEEKLEAALEHLKFAVEICLQQQRAGRLFLFEHPSTASSWYSESIKLLASVTGVYHVKFDFCMAGMKTKNKAGESVPAKKRTGVLTNSSAIASMLRGAQCRREHVHEPLLDGKAGPCQEYPEKFCRLVCEGVKRELDTVEWKNRMNKIFDLTTPFGQLMRVQEKIELATPPEEDPFAMLYEDGEFVDDISGAPLNKAMAIQARKLEIEFFKKMGVYTKMKREPWMKPITTRWIDTNKGDIESPDYRARLVGREIKRDKRDDLFAATPPLESLRMLLSICASNQRHLEEHRNHIIMSNDIKRAYFYAPATRPVFIIIPDEDFEQGDECRVGQLNLSLYGTRDAALNWSKTYSEYLVSIGFRRGRASPCNFYHEEKGISTTVHGDDFTSSGPEAALHWMDKKLRAKFEVKTNFLGPKECHSKQIRVINRVLTWGDEGITYEADQRHAEIIVQAMDVTKPVTTPGSREETTAAGPPNVTSSKLTPVPPKYDEEMQQKMEFVNAIAEGKVRDGCDEDPPLGPAEASTFRALAARANYLAQDRPDIQFAVKEIARRMATPVGRDWSLFKRLARYLLGAPRAVSHFYWQDEQRQFDVFVDSDWAGCKTTARSTSGGAAKFGWHTIKTWSATQTVVALSSGEAELYSLTKGAAQTLGLIAMARDLGIEAGGMLHTDASAALGIVSREGLGKLRHVNVQFLWIQDRIRGGDLSAHKVNGAENPADLMTKYLPASDIYKHMEHLCCTLHDSRADAAPHLAVLRLEEDENGDADWWNTVDEEVTRQHRKPRKCLFTPTRVRGAPPGTSLTSARVTEGQYLDNGEHFKVVDNWRNRSTSNTAMPRRWTGTTRFWMKTGVARVVESEF